MWFLKSLLTDRNKVYSFQMGVQWGKKRKKWEEGENQIKEGKKER